MMKVLHPGFFCSIQDLGREHYMHWGVPESGSMDRLSARLANALVGNPEESAVIGFAMQGPNLEFSEPCVLAVSGAEFEIFLDDEPMPMDTAFLVKKGQVLHFGKLENGLRGYLAIAGGFLTEEVLGSRSYCNKVTKRARLEKGMQIPYITSTKLEKFSVIGMERPVINASILEVYPGPEFDLLTKSQKKAIETTEFEVNNRNNRMAYQLDPPLKPLTAQILTGIVIPGTVQITPLGSLFVLMRDGQTTGGYPRILQLTETSINALSQMRTGSSFKLKIIASE